MKIIPIFDSLTHPMPNGNWLDNRWDGKNKIDELAFEMKRNTIEWAFAVGMGNSIGNYSLDNYANFVRETSDKMFPIAYLDLKGTSEKSISESLLKIKKNNYLGIKIHPRFSQIKMTDSLIRSSIKAANDLDLIVLVCSYYWSSDRINGYLDLQQMIEHSADEKFILMHGGGVHLLEVAEQVKFTPNIILDLSFTMSKYAGSSIDLDIKYVMNSLDRKVCIGSDSPEFTQQHLRERFDLLAAELPREKQENIAYKNLLKLVGIKI